MSFTFSGRSVAIVAPKGATRGSAKVYVDGVLKTTVDLHASSTVAQGVVYSLGVVDERTGIPSRSSWSARPAIPASTSTRSSWCAEPGHDPRYVVIE